MDNFYNKHYILTDHESRVTDGWSDGPHPDRDTTRAICINDKGGYQFRLFPDGEENPALYDMDGIPLYKWDSSQVIQRTQEELEAERAAIPVPEPVPTQAERLAALEAENKLLTAQVAAQSDQLDFYEDCIAEMASIVYA